MTEQIITPLLPPSLDGDGYRRQPAQRPGPVLGPPLAVVPDLPRAPVDVVYGMGRVDAAGRVFDRAIVRCLGWCPGDRVTITGTTAVVVATREDTGLVTLPARPCLVVPAALRHRCGVTPGDRVLLAAYPRLDRLVVYPLATVHQILLARLSGPPSDVDEPAPTTTAGGDPARPGVSSPRSTGGHR